MYYFYICKELLYNLFFCVNRLVELTDNPLINKFIRALEQFGQPDVIFGVRNCNHINVIFGVRNFYHNDVIFGG